MLIERFEKRLCPVIPQLDLSVMERAKDPRTSRMERYTFHTAALGLKFGEHILSAVLFRDGEVDHFLDHQGDSSRESLHALLSVALSADSRGSRMGLVDYADRRERKRVWVIRPSFSLLYAHLKMHGLAVIKERWEDSDSVMREWTCREEEHPRFVSTLTCTSHERRERGNDERQ